MSDPTDNVERLRRTAQSLGSAVVILTAAEGEQIADEIVKLRERKCPCPCHLPGNIGMALCDADWASDE